MYKQVLEKACVHVSECMCECEFEWMGGNEWGGDEGAHCSVATSQRMTDVSHLILSSMLCGRYNKPHLLMRK